MGSGDRFWKLAGAACGILGPVLLQLGFGLRAAGWGGGFIDPTTPKEQIASLFARPAPALALAGDAFQALGMMCFLIFAARLWATLRQAEGEGAWISAITLASAILFSAAGLGALAAERAVDIRAGHGLDASAAVALVTMNGAFFSLFGVFTSLFLGATAIVVLRTRALPAWLGWSAAAIALTRLAGEVPLAGALGEGVNFLFIFWILAASVTLLVRREMTPSASAVAVAVNR